MTALQKMDGSGAMFDAIAHRYDLVNRVVSFGIDKRWRRKTIAALELAAGDRVLDLATGTADLAIAVARSCDGVEVIGIDPSAGMLSVGAHKVGRAGLSDRIALLAGDAQALDLADGSVDAVCMGFGIRNVPDRAQALREIARVTRRGGRVAILELSEPRSGILGPLARFHVHTLVPRIGSWLSRAPQYRYLEKSIAKFPAPAQFAATMEANGLTVLRVAPLTFGVCCLFVATPKAVEQGATA